MRCLFFAQTKIRHFIRGFKNSLIKISDLAVPRLQPIRKRQSRLVCNRERARAHTDDLRRIAVFV